MKSGRSGALKLRKLGLSCKANKCSHTGTGDLGVLTTHEPSPIWSFRFNPPWVNAATSSVMCLIKEILQVDERLMAARMDLSVTKLVLFSITVLQTITLIVIDQISFTHAALFKDQGSYWPRHP